MTAEITTYNGWTNRETWATALWLANDEGLYNAATEYAAQDEHGDALKDWIDELVHDAIEGGPEYRDTRLMLNDIGSLYRVNWPEVRAAFFDEDEN